MSIMEYNGGAVLAMTGKDCVAIACDLRFGSQNQTLGFDNPKVFPVHERLYVGLPGLATDMHTLNQRFQFRTSLYKMREERLIKPETFMNLVSSMLYEKRWGPYFVEPVIAGLDPDSNKPFIASMDLIGCPMCAKDFVAAGTCDEQMMGMCESMWRPDMSPDDLFETVSQCLLAAVGRDALSGWGAIVHVITPTKVISKTLKGRQD